jgi:hypothetical protein
MSDWMFHRDAIRAFRFVRCGFDPATGVARLVYAYDDGPELVETITVPGAPFDLAGARAPVRSNGAPGTVIVSTSSGPSSYA